MKNFKLRMAAMAMTMCLALPMFTGCDSNKSSRERKHHKKHETEASEVKEASEMHETEALRAPDNDNDTSTLKVDLSTLEVGQYFDFGYYGDENMVWQVVDIQDGKALIVCKNAVEAMAYNETGEAVSWEECSLRTWLNDEFYNVAFTDEERSHIVLTNLSTSGSETYNTTGGNDTYDYVFIPGYFDELWTYFSREADRPCIITVHATENYEQEDAMECIWWTRSPGEMQNQIMYITPKGAVKSTKYVGKKYGVRPAMWIEMR